MCSPNSEGLESAADDHGSVDAEWTSNSGTSTSSAKATDEDGDGIKDLLSRKVVQLRVLVLIALLLAAAAVSIVIYLITRNAEMDEFEIQFDGNAEKVIESFTDIVKTMGAISGLGVAITAHSQNTKSKWPFHSLSNFQERAGNARTLSGTLYVSVNPIVDTKEELDMWEEYVLGESNQWYDDGLAFQEKKGLNTFQNEIDVKSSWLTDKKVDPLHSFSETGEPFLQTSETGPYLPRWQTSPVLRTSRVNEDLFFKPGVATTVSKQVMAEGSAILGGFVTAPPGPPSHVHTGTAFLATLRSMWEGEQVEYHGDPMAQFQIPVFDSFNETTRKPVAIMKSLIHWRHYFRNILPSNVDGITVILENECDGVYTYEINGKEAFVTGFGDLHERKFDHFRRTAEFETGIDVLDDGTSTGVKLIKGDCKYFVHVYPSETFYRHYVTKRPIITTCAIAMVFVFTAAMFLFYDRLVARRQVLILAKATQSTAIVSSLFPKQVRDRLMQTESDRNGGAVALASNNRLKTFLTGDDKANDGGGQPIADLFPHCTVYFADIAGFTAWSSTREPAQVFVLLQAVYQAFDLLAKRRRVFKVETIGDSYLAVTGLPEPQANHAMIMAKFTFDCMEKLKVVIRELEVTLGPDTADLSMRFGLHSGPVTAGVLRGDRARFQVFGDTVNTASRMESTGFRGRIHISQTTADLIIAAGKAHWIKPREDLVQAKGKGTMQTYWLNPAAAKKGSSVASSEGEATSPIFRSPVKDFSKEDRLVQWMVELLMEHMKKIIVKRGTERSTSLGSPIVYNPPDGTTCLDEVKEVIEMSAFNAKAAASMENYNSVEVSDVVVAKLLEYVSVIALTYRSNPFHNFEHACHVTMSVSKLLNRIVTPDLSREDMDQLEEGGLSSHLHDFTHGIHSDPMAVFAIVFSALIHDADHRGVSNVQLAKEEPEMGDLYHCKSVAEQNSLDVSWELLMSPKFDQLRALLFGTEAELMRFRQLIVNVVLATDIFDKELNDMRKTRWERAFSSEGGQPAGQDMSDLRATIVMEHIIQASDVSHTMQHWHVYQKWNKHLFMEMYEAYQAGRMGADPSKFWYQGELGFFDNYIIPLAKKLKECNVFGVSSDEYLNYAIRNRAEWEERGMEITDEYVSKAMNASATGIDKNDIV